MEGLSDRQTRWVLGRFAELLEVGAEPVRGLITPTSEFFPDGFDGTPKSVARLLGRTKEHAGLASVPMDLAIITPEGAAVTVSCSSGACGTDAFDAAKVRRVTPKAEGGYVVSLAAQELGHPVALTTALVRAVAQAFLLEAAADEDFAPEEMEPTVDLASTMLGFGVLMANGSHIVVKGCGGMKVHSATRMPVEETTFALALFCSHFGVPSAGAKRHLDPTQRESFAEAEAWMANNGALLKMMKGDRELIVRGDYELGESKGILSRLFGIGRKAKAKAPTQDELEALAASQAAKARATTKDPAKAKRLAEIRALVDEAMAGE